MEKKNFSPSLQKSPNPNPNLKKSQNLPQQKSQSPNPIPIYLSSFLPLQPNTVALFQYLPSASLSLTQKISLSKIQKLSKNIKKLSNIDNKNVTILPWFWGFSPFKHPKTAISCHFPWLLTHSLAPCVLSLRLASETPSKGLKKRKSRRTFLQSHGMKKNMKKTKMLQASKYYLSKKAVLLLQCRFP